MDAIEIAKQIIRECLQLDSTASELEEFTQLAGHMPEFNSLTITTIITSIEDELDCVIDDDELTIDIFESVGTLAEFISTKM